MTNARICRHFRTKIDRKGYYSGDWNHKHERYETDE